ncbi:glutamate racemase [Candidatus Enterovibrio altilux]|nr:glutamate racemase [Candidatus Enterovibrio luxaltus]
MKVKSVLIFDSGVGGLSVYKEIIQLIPGQHVIYAFDNAAFPYGELEYDVLISRVCGMVLAVCSTHDVALVVVACNTASTLVLPYLREKLSIPIVGVVPAIKPAAALSQMKKIGLLATPATVQRPYTYQLVKKFMRDCDINMIGSTELVLMSESKLCGKPVDKRKLQNILAPFINQVDYIVLGCTHFPLLKSEIQEIVGDSCTIIDSGKAVACRVAELLIEESPRAFLYKHRVFSSALVNKDSALNQELSHMGFSSIERAPPF